MVGGYNRKRVVMVIIHSIFWYFSAQHLASNAAKEGAFSGKAFSPFVGEVTKCYNLGHFVPCPILCAANLMQVHYMQHALFEQQK